MLALIAALIPLPVAAREATPAAKAKTSQVSLKDGVARAAARTPLAVRPARRADQSSASGKDSTSFFKTPTGAVALAVMALGAGYAVYSVTHDRITSPAKK